MTDGSAVRHLCMSVLLAGGCDKFVLRTAVLPYSTLLLTSRLTHHTPVPHARVLCGAVLTGAIFYARPDGEQCAHGLLHDEHCVGRL